MMIDIIKRFDGEYEFMSNFSRHGFTFKTIHFPTNEHFYQAMKCKVGNVDSFNEIIKVSTPGKAKRLGRKVDMRSDWENIKLDVMKDGLIAKFEQNPEIKQKLKDTGGALLVEGNHWHDNFWGNCTCEKCILTMGKNMLGVLLMFVRSQI